MDTRTSWTAIFALIVTLSFLLAPGVASADGTLDPTFSGDGLVQGDAVPDYDESVADIEVDSKGRILVLILGTFPSSNYQASFLIRYLNDGTVDQTFSVGDDPQGNGIKLLGAAQDSSLEDMALDSKGRIVLAGSLEIGPVDRDAFIVRLLPDGAFDNTFSGNGLQAVDVASGSEDRVYAVQVDSSDRPVLGGERQLLSQPPKSVVFRSTVDGDLDTGFGENGFAFPITGPSSTFTNDLAVDGQGRIVVAGSGSAEPGLTAARLLGDGSIDLSFSGDGHQSVVFDGNPLLQRAVAVELDAEDRIVLFGYAPTAELDPNDDLIQARLLDNGNLDPAFGQGGRNRILTDTSDEGVGASAIDSAGRLVIGGSFSNASTDGKEGLVARVGDSGLFDQGFGQAGFIRQDWNQPRAEVYGLTIDAEGRYLVASDLTLADDTRQIGLARYTVDYPKEPDPPDPPQKPVVKCSGKAATITGSTKKDRLKGTKKRDVIQGLGGNDVIKGLKGNDLICGGKGNDKLIGGPGKDVLRGDAGKDKLFGGPAKDRLIGGKGRDRCLKGPGKGRLSGCERRR